MAQMRAYKQSKGEGVKSEVELYEDLEPVLVQEMNKEERELWGGCEYGGSVQRRGLVILACFCIIFYLYLRIVG